MNKSTLFILGAFLLISSPQTHAEEMPAMGEMSAEQMQMMKNFEAYSTPGDMHAELAKMTGNWNAKVQHWMAPGAPVEVSEGTAESKPIFGGRFIKQEFSSEWMGQPFQGLGIFGYDNIQQEFQSIWLDSMATGMMVSSGQLADDGTMVEEGTFSCPLTNSERWNQSKTTFVTEDTFTFEMFMKDDNGDEFRSMLITYTRKP
ncbi:MAG: DUF1579 domain-containing protein [Candidatus Omnitrophica bacterium]|nr:DUF1579 domain-containing protein [Candidatus Omnitrophota bacterium]